MKTIYHILFASIFAFVLFGVTNATAAGPLVCPCAGGSKCQLQKGREQENFTYDPRNMAAYDALEAAAMAKADQKAADAASAAELKYAGLMCPAPCGAAATATSHGKPFAGGTEGRGIARSRWEVDYICALVPPPPPPPPGGKPVMPGPGNGPPPPPPPEHSKWYIAVPEIPKCFGLPVDKDEMIEHLRELRASAAVNMPLGAEKGDPDMEEALAQMKINLAAIDTALDLAYRTPLCPPRRPGLFDNIEIGIGIGGGGDHHHDHDHHGERHDHPDHPTDEPHD